MGSFLQYDESIFSPCPLSVPAGLRQVSVAPDQLFIVLFGSVWFSSVWFSSVRTGLSWFRLGWVGLGLLLFGSIKVRFFFHDSLLWVTMDTESPSFC